MSTIYIVEKATTWCVSPILGAPGKLSVDVLTATQATLVVLHNGSPIQATALEVGTSTLSQLTRIGETKLWIG